MAEKMAEILVRVSLVIPVKVPADPGFNVEFAIEENGCPGTGMVWGALQKIIQRGEDEGTCWACKYQGKNEIVPKPKPA